MNHLDNIVSIYRFSTVFEKYFSRNISINFGIDFSDWIILRSIGEKTSLIDLARQMEFTSAGSTNAADRLQKKGLLDRVEDEHDRRRKYLKLTKHASILLKEIDNYLLSHYHSIFNQIEDIDRLVNDLAKLRDIMNSLNESENEVS